MGQDHYFMRETLRLLSRFVLFCKTFLFFQRGKYILSVLYCESFLYTLCMDDVKKWNEKIGILVSVILRGIIQVFRNVFSYMKIFFRLASPLVSAAVELGAPIPDPETLALFPCLSGTLILEQSRARYILTVRLYRIPSKNDSLRQIFNDRCNHPPEPFLSRK